MLSLIFRIAQFSSDAGRPLSRTLRFSSNSPPTMPSPRPRFSSTTISTWSRMETPSATLYSHPSLKSPIPAQNSSRSISAHTRSMKQKLRSANSPSTSPAPKTTSRKSSPTPHSRTPKFLRYIVSRPHRLFLTCSSALTFTTQLPPLHLPAHQRTSISKYPHSKMVRPTQRPYPVLNQPQSSPMSSTVH